MIRIVVVTPFAPTDKARHAGQLFVTQYVRCLAGLGQKLSVIAPGTSDNRSDSVGGLLGIDVELFDLRRPSVSDLLEYLSRLRRDGFGAGLGFEGAFRSAPQLPAIFASADIVYLMFPTLLCLSDTVRAMSPKAKIIAFEVDVFSESVDRGRHFGSPLRRLVSRLRYPLVRRAERSLLNGVHLVLVFHHGSKDYLRRLGVESRVATFAPLLPVPRVTNQSVRNSAGAGVIFVAAFYRPENCEGLAWLITAVWPHVISRMPSAHLGLVGGDMPTQLRSRLPENVVAYGYVGCLAEAYERHAVAVAPLLRGSGVKFKVIEALLHGMPVVATTIAAEGIESAGTTEGFLSVANDPRLFADHLVNLLAHPAERRAAGMRAREWALPRFTANDGRFMEIRSLHRKVLSTVIPSSDSSSAS